MNGWIEELALRLLPSTAAAGDRRKCKDTFARRIKQHNFGRTNQFEVAERLDGLEEKFQVLCQDELSDALHDRRVELSEHDERWLPDVLDLLLHLSHDAVNPSRLDDLARVQARAESPPPLRWAEVEADDPIDHRDPMWRVPDYSDFSSEEDEVPISSVTTSPVSVNNPVQKFEDAACEVEGNEVFDNTPTDPGLVDGLRTAQFWQRSGEYVTVTEIQALREVLFMFQGRPTALYVIDEEQLQPDPRFRLSHAGPNVFQSLLRAAAVTGTELNVLRRWLRVPQEMIYVQHLQSRIGTAMSQFERELSKMEHQLLHHTAENGVASPVQTVQIVERKASHLHPMMRVTREATPKGPISLLEALFNHIDRAHSCCDETAVQALLPLFISAFELYTQPIDVWLQTGAVHSLREPFFVAEGNEATDKARLWETWFTLESKDGRLMPSFLQAFAPQIFAAGKTAAFLQQGMASSNDDRPLVVRGAAREAADMTTNRLVSFDSAFNNVLERRVTTALVTMTARLSAFLEDSCGLSETLDALDYLYLGRSSVVVDKIETKVFDQIDRRLETWNDRFLIMDMLEEVLDEVDCIDPDRLVVQSAYTSSRTMESRRRSVKILGALSIDYVLPWPIANVIVPASLASYGRVALLLRQIRRAKYILDRRGYFYVQNAPFRGDPIDQLLAQTLHFTLSLFVNTVYDHLTTCVIQPTTSTMRAGLSGTVDQMITAHRTYTHTLEFGCLTSGRLKLIRDALTSILDLCIHFTDLVSTPASAMRKSSVDFEASSYMSAASRRRRRGGGHVSNAEDSDEEDDDEGEGYSTFILDENVSVEQEMAKVKTQFMKHATFFVAGLRGIARAGDSGELFELLADRLDAVVPQRQ